MKRLVLKPTLHWFGASFDMLMPGGERKLLRRVYVDDAAKKKGGNLLIWYEPEDEIYEHYDAMLTWEED